MKNKDQRIAVLVDVGNMYHSARSLYHARVNYQEVLKVAVGDRKLIRALAYVIQSYTPEEKTFFEALEKQGFEIKMKDLQVFPGGMKKGDWDVGLSVDAIRLSPRLDAIILVTGDGDYEPLVEYLQNNGVQVEVVAFSESASQRLIDRADSFIDLSENTKKYIIAVPKKK
jgi:uncharacterized protein (TIGR00288 family)